MSGWSWGELRFDGATAGPYDILGQPGEGMPLLRHHFARYHPLVIAGGSLHARRVEHLAAGGVTDGVSN